MFMEISVKCFVDILELTQRAGYDDVVRQRTGTVVTECIIVQRCVECDTRNISATREHVDLCYRVDQYNGEYRDGQPQGEAV